MSFGRQHPSGLLTPDTVSQATFHTYCSFTKSASRAPRDGELSSIWHKHLLPKVYF